jgi:cysteine-rich repeat protein
VTAQRVWLINRSGRAAFACSALLGASLVVVACGGDKPIPPPPHTTTSTSSGIGGDPSGPGGAGGTGGVGGVGGNGGSGGAPPLGCGDGAIVFPEQCDGTDLGGVTCKDVGYDGGVLSCAKSCQLDESKCTKKEQCTDGLDNDKDTKSDCADSDCAQACAASCTPEALTVITPDFTVVSGDTTGHANQLSASCSAMSGGASGPEIVYQATVKFAGVLDLELLSDANLGISVRGACTPQGAELGCADDASGPQAVERLKLPVSMNDTVFIAVQGYAAADVGTYSLSVKNRAVTCGDGYADPPEQCDDGAAVPGDGCDAQCAVESSEAEPTAPRRPPTPTLRPGSGRSLPRGTST